MQQGIGGQREEDSVRNAGRREREAQSCSRAERTRPSIGLEKACDFSDLAGIESLESRTWERAAPRVSMSAGRDGAHVTRSKAGSSFGTNRGDCGNVTARDSAKTARVSAATREDPRADGFRRPPLFRFAPMRVPPRLPALPGPLRSRDSQSAKITAILCDFLGPHGSPASHPSAAPLRRQACPLVPLRDVHALHDEPQAQRYFPNGGDPQDGEDEGGDPGRKEICETVDHVTLEEYQADGEAELKQREREVRLSL